MRSHPVDVRPQPSMRPGRARSALAALGVVALSAGLVLSACGSDSKDDKADQTTTTSAAPGGSSSTTAGSTPVSADSRFCDAWKAVEVATAQGPGGPDGPPDPAAIKAFAATVQEPIADATAAAPAELVATVGSIKKVVDDTAGGGDPSMFDPSNPALAQPLGDVQTWAYDNCGWQQLEITAQDYAFVDLPDDVDAGPTMVKFVNVAKDEAHMIQFGEITDSKVTQQEVVDALEQDPAGAEQKYQSSVSFESGVEAGPGETSYAYVDFEPGRYVGACFIPIGGKDDGMPHTTKGMVGQFEVK